MKPFNSKEIQGSWGAALLPIQEDGAIDKKALSAEIDYLVDCRIDGIYTNGTSGEFFNISESEYDHIHHLVAEKCESAGIPFQLGSSHMSPWISLSRVKRAAQLKPGAIQVILPDWAPTSRQEQIDFLKRLAEEADPIGLVLYNPPHAKQVLTPEEIGILKENVPQLIGIKVVDGTRDWYTQMEEYLKNISVFVPGHHLATGFQYGAQGSYSNIACLSPKGAQRWYDMMKTDMAKALEWERKILRFMQKHILPLARAGYSNAALDKLLAAIGNWANVGTRLRWPYRGIPEEEVQRLRPLVQQELPELFIS